MKYITVCFAIALGVAAVAAQNSPQPSDIATTINGAGGGPPRLAVPAFLALSSDAETVAAAKTISDVLWNDLNYEHEFTFVARDVYSTIPVAKSIDDPPLDRWREVDADAVIAGSVQRSGNQLLIRYRLFNVRSRQQVLGAEYTGSANARRYAHTISDEIFKRVRNLDGVARTKLAFSSDRDGERLAGTIENRTVREIYISDYDGENQQRVTVGRTLNAFPSWSPDGRAIAYVSWRRGQPNIFVSHIYDGTLEEITKNLGENYLPAWSPDGTRIAFSSDRSGTPQIYTISADGLGGVQRLTAEPYADKPTWSTATNEIAFESRTGARFDIKVIDMNTRSVKQLTFGEGSNESPVFSPNGRHLAFMSDRGGKFQIYTMTRDGRDARQITRSGSNTVPSWSH